MDSFLLISRQGQPPRLEAKHFVRVPASPTDLLYPGSLQEGRRGRPATGGVFPEPARATLYSSASAPERSSWRNHDYCWSRFNHTLCNFGNLRATRRTWLPTQRVRVVCTCSYTQSLTIRIDLGALFFMLCTYYLFCRRLVVAFRGTDSLNTMLTDVNVAASKWNLTSSHGSRVAGAHVHGGFYRSYRALHPKLVPVRARKR